MRPLLLIRNPARSGFQADDYASDFSARRASKGERRFAGEIPMPRPFGMAGDDASTPCGKEGFFQGLSAEAQSDFASLATRFQCPGSTVLISEAEKPSGVLFLLEGEVNISMNSSDGRRLLLGIAGAGDSLGLASAISGECSEIRAQATYPCSIASMHRRDFLGFLSRHPIAGENVARELCSHLASARARSRILGLTSSALARLAHLLLEWCKDGQQTKTGIQIRCVLTHLEIAECIGASRETVTRALADFKAHDLLKVRGSTIVVMNRCALASYAGIDSIPDPAQPAA